MTEPICPFCNQVQTKKPKKSWVYGTPITNRTKKGTIRKGTITCFRYQCKCEKYFNYYLSSEGNSWTNPKNKKE